MNMYNSILMPGDAVGAPPDPVIPAVCSGRASTAPPSGGLVREGLPKEIAERDRRRAANTLASRCLQQFPGAYLSRRPGRPGR